ncbi:MAG: MerR family transcriptional regulator [Rhodosalinus sp.]
MSHGSPVTGSISEVAEWLDTPAHVLRFWESKFPQVKPVKRAGGRRYYRPSDMALIGGIKRLLHDEGMTIKGVQKLLREQGVRHVASLSPPIEDTGETLEAGTGGTVLPFEAKARRSVPQDAETIEAAAAADPPQRHEAPTETAGTPAEERAGDASAATTAGSDTSADAAEEHAPAPPEPETDREQSATERPEEASAPAQYAGPTDAEKPEVESVPETAPDSEAPEQAQADLFFRPDPPAAQGVTLKPAGDLPSFLRGGPRVPQAAPPADTYYPPRPQPIRINLPPDPEDGALKAGPGPLARIARLRRLPPEAARAMRPHLSALAGIHARRAARPHD